MENEITISPLAKFYLEVIRSENQPLNFRVGPHATIALKNLLQYHLVEVINERFYITECGKQYLAGLENTK